MDRLAELQTKLGLEPSHVHRLHQDRARLGIVDVSRDLGRATAEPQLVRARQHLDERADVARLHLAVAHMTEILEEQLLRLVAPHILRHPIQRREHLTPPADEPDAIRVREQLDERAELRRSARLSRLFLVAANRSARTSSVIVLLFSAARSGYRRARGSPSRCRAAIYDTEEATA